MRKSFISTVASSVLPFLLLGVMFAQQEKEPLKAVMSASKIVVHNNLESKQSATTAKPGDVIEYTVEYHNQSAKALRDVRGVLPIPTGMSFEAESAFPKNVWASTDGQTFSAAPLKRRQKNPDGSETEVAVPLKEYRALRWELGEIAPNSSKSVKARVKVLTNATPVTEPTKH